MNHSYLAFGFSTELFSQVPQATPSTKSSKLFESEKAASLENDILNTEMEQNRHKCDQIGLMSPLVSFP